MDTNQPDQTTQTPPAVTPELSLPPQENLNPKSSSKNKSVVLILVLLILGLLVLLVYLFYQNMQLKQQVELMEIENPAAVTCEYNGQTYEAGEGFTASDGCNSCSCSETGEVACTLMACEPTTENSDQNGTTVDWRSYQDEKYSFKYPPEFVALRQATQSENPKLSLKYSNNNDYSDISFELSTNLQGFGVEFKKLISSGTFSVHDRDISFEVYADCSDDDCRQITNMRTLYLSLSPGDMIIATFNTDHEEYAMGIVDQILSTFEFTD